MKQKRATLSNGFILGPNNKLIKVTKRVLKQFQDGGFEIKNGVVSKKRKRSKAENHAENKRIKLGDIEQYIDLFQFVNAVVSVC